MDHSNTRKSPSNVDPKEFMKLIDNNRFDKETSSESFDDKPKCALKDKPIQDPLPKSFI